LPLNLLPRLSNLNFAFETFPSYLQLFKRKLRSWFLTVTALSVVLIELQSFILVDLHLNWAVCINCETRGRGSLLLVALDVLGI